MKDQKNILITKRVVQQSAAKSFPSRRVQDNKNGRIQDGIPNFSNSVFIFSVKTNMAEYQ